MGAASKNNWVMTNWYKIVGLSLVLTALLSIDYLRLTVSQALLEAPLQIILVAFLDTLVLSYFVTASRWTGLREGIATFLVFYGVGYGLVAMESIYLGDLLPANVALGVLVNGAIRSTVFTIVLVWALGGKGTQSEGANSRLVMPIREWVWKIVGAGAVWMLLFILFGAVVYLPLATFLDPVGLSQELGANLPLWALPFQAIRGTIWVLLAVPAIIALRTGWRKTALIVGLLFAIPMSANLLLPTGMSLGLQVAHFIEVSAENFVFGVFAVWILHLRSRLPASSS
jgi:hypothetical protein